MCSSVHEYGVLSLGVSKEDFMNIPYRFGMSCCIYVTDSGTKPIEFTHMFTTKVALNTN